MFGSIYTWPLMYTHTHTQKEKKRGGDVVTTFGKLDDVIGFNFDYKVFRLQLVSSFFCYALPIHA